jgi:hypothetical protein
MPAFPAAIRIYVALEPVSIRKQYGGLWEAEQVQLEKDPERGTVFCFANKERTRLKLRARCRRI